VPKSVLEAVKSGYWDFEPERVDKSRYTPTGALPGSEEKLTVLEQRIQLGLPLWHPEDRLFYRDELEDEEFNDDIA